MNNLVPVKNDLQLLCEKHGIRTAASDLSHSIASIKRRGKRLDKDIQSAALGAIAHHALHGQVGPINNLIDAMPAGSRVNALREYIETFGAVTYDPAIKKFVHSKIKKADIKGALKSTWTSHKPDPEYKPLDNPMARFDQLVTLFEKDMKNLGTQSKVTPAMITAIKHAKAEALEAAILH
jgi:hypothetical protein